MNDFFLLPWSGRLDGSMKLWFLRRRCVLCRLRRAIYEFDFLVRDGGLMS
jgi:hypothetical protein